MRIIQGDCLDVMKSMPDASVDAIVTDPPAGISFMGKDWDKNKGGRQQWIAWMTNVARECLRVVKPGSHALVWAIPRTSHWTGMSWEDAGWEPRDKIFHAFGSGFPKSANISKMIDKHFGKEREVVATVKKKPSASSDCNEGWVRPWAEGKTTMDITAPATAEAKRYEGYGSALKPAVEEWWLFRKPISEGTIAANVLKHGTGGLNIDGCRIGTEQAWRYPNGPKGNTDSSVIYGGGKGLPRREQPLEGPQGRYPANLILSDDPDVLECFPVTGNSSSSFRGAGGGGEKVEQLNYRKDSLRGHNDAGSAARFFKRIAYFSKASKRDRDEGCEGLEEVMTMRYSEKAQGPLPQQTPSKPVLQRNHHPTVKNTELMRYLCKLITPANGIILDPFMGSGSTGKAAMMEGFQFIGIELNPEYVEIAQNRIDAATRQMKLF